MFSYEHRYTASGGMEYFLSFETSDEKVVFGFARLRLSEESGICGEHTFPELRNTALVRELHVYGQVREYTFFSSKICGLKIFFQKVEYSVTD